MVTEAEDRADRRVQQAHDDLVQAPTPTPTPTLVSHPPCVQAKRLHADECDRQMAQAVEKVAAMHVDSLNTLADTHKAWLASPDPDANPISNPKAEIALLKEERERAVHALKKSIAETQEDHGREHQRAVAAMQMTIQEGETERRAHHERVAQLEAAQLQKDQQLAAAQGRAMELEVAVPSARRHTAPR